MVGQRGQTVIVTVAASTLRKDEDFRPFWLLLPAAAEGLINLYQGEEFIETGLREA